VPTIYDVAKRAKVSTYTVSSVLNQTAHVSAELTERVRRAVDELNYTVNELARSLPKGKTKTVGMLIPDIGNPFYAKVVRGVEDRLRSDGYSLLLGNTYNKGDEQCRYLSLFGAKQADGLMVFPSAGDESEIRRLVRSRKPMVFVGRSPRSFEADCVSADNREGARMATAYLIDRGHRRIAIVSGERAVTASSERVEGWRDALQSHSIGLPDDYVGEGDWTADSGFHLTIKLLELPEPPTAILSANFLILTGVLRALKSRGLRHPQQVEVMSWDDSDWLDVFEPSVSTVVASSYAMGEGAADLLLERMRQPDREYQRIVISTQLKIRTP